MHIVRPSNRYSGARVNEVGEISAALKGLAKELDVPVIALTQLSRQVENRGEWRSVERSGCVAFQTGRFD
jgi:replicative DNA helicase